MDRSCYIVFRCALRSCFNLIELKLTLLFAIVLLGVAISAIPWKLSSSINTYKPIQVKSSNCPLTVLCIATTRSISDEHIYLHFSPRAIVHDRAANLNIPPLSHHSPLITFGDFCNNDLTTSHPLPANAICTLFLALQRFSWSSPL